MCMLMPYMRCDFVNNGNDIININMELFEINRYA